MNGATHISWAELFSGHITYQRANVRKGPPTQGLLSKWLVCLTLQIPRVFETLSSIPPPDTSSSLQGNKLISFRIVDQERIAFGDVEQPHQIDNR